MTHQDTVNRQIYGRLFKGAVQEISRTTQSSLIGAVFDKTLMPAIVLDPGKTAFQSFSLAQNASYTVPLPPDYDVLRPMYVAIYSTLKSTVTYENSIGASQKVLLYGSDSTTDGTHGAFWSYQGDLISLVISVPSTANGGATTSFQVFLYEIPDLADFESYFDKQIGLGTSGDT